MDSHFKLNTLTIRIVHKPASFWMAKEECKALSGRLLQLNHTAEVFKTLNQSMIGNVESDYRIDGWSEGIWFEGPSQKNIAKIETEDGSFLNVMKARTLSMNLEDGSVHTARHIDSRIGSICQWNSGVGQTGCKDESESLLKYL